MSIRIYQYITQKQKNKSLMVLTSLMQRNILKIVLRNSI
ncbi:hypothetical protein pb186bvf_003635 [Paramecium bursaria]